MHLQKLETYKNKLENISKFIIPFFLNGDAYIILFPFLSTQLSVIYSAASKSTVIYCNNRSNISPLLHLLAHK